MEGRVAVTHSDRFDFLARKPQMSAELVRPTGFEPVAFGSGGRRYGWQGDTSAQALCEILAIRPAIHACQQIPLLGGTHAESSAWNAAHTNRDLCARQVRAHQVQRSFPRETPITDVLVWREEMRRQLTLQHGSGSGSLSADIGSYLSAQTRARRRNAEGWLMKWAKRFGDRRRTSLTYEELRDALGDWQSERYSASSLNSRVPTSSRFGSTVRGRMPAARCSPFEITASRHRTREPLIRRSGIGRSARCATAAARRDS